MKTVKIARCEQHGLHGERDRCWVCDRPCEQVEMVEADVHRYALGYIEALESRITADIQEEALAEAMQKAGAV